MCKCCDSKRYMLSLLLDSVSMLEEKRKAIEELFDAESEAFFPIQDRVALAGAELLGVNLDSAIGDAYYDIFFAFAFDKVDKEETLDRLMAL